MRSKPLDEIIEQVETAFGKLEEHSSDLSTWDKSPHYKDFIDAWIELKAHYLDFPPKDGIVKIPYQFLYLYAASASAIVEQMIASTEHETKVKLADIWYGLSGVLDDIIELAQDATGDAED